MHMCSKFELAHCSFEWQTAPMGTWLVRCRHTLCVCAAVRQRTHQRTLFKDYGNDEYLW